MEFEKIVERVHRLKWLTTDQGKDLYDLVLNNDIHNILELGFYHGVSTLYMAGALHEKKSKGAITTIDRIDSKDLTPNISTLIKDLEFGLSVLEFGKHIQAIYAHNCYSWELLRLLEEKPRPLFDLVFIDGAHIWKTDALAFFLCDKMLKQGGWIIFDDVKWTMAKNSDPHDNQWTQKYSEEEIKTAQIQKVFDLLVKEHPNYGEFREEDGFAFARKLHSDKVNYPKESTVVKTVMVTKEMMLEKLKAGSPK